MNFLWSLSNTVFGFQIWLRDEKAWYLFYWNWDWVLLFIHSFPFISVLNYLIKKSLQETLITFFNLLCDEFLFICLTSVFWYFVKDWLKLQVFHNSRRKRWTTFYYFLVFPVTGTIHQRMDHETKFIINLSCCSWGLVHTSRNSGKMCQGLYFNCCAQEISEKKRIIQAAEDIWKNSYHKDNSGKNRFRVESNSKISHCWLE